ncbi:hypothetical protein N7G274_000127 [Stereocaulon virgatum]|uniref:Secreted protein n=1 Tax=Stereocaulon virgatum TaxID=373712 RepID=A0ABR4ATS7_9LECA
MQGVPEILQSWLWALCAWLWAPPDWPKRLWRQVRLMGNPLLPSEPAHFTKYDSEFVAQPVGTAAGNDALLGIHDQRSTDYHLRTRVSGRHETAPSWREHKNVRITYLRRSTTLSPIENSTSFFISSTPRYTHRTQIATKIQI